MTTRIHRPRQRRGPASRSVLPLALPLAPLLILGAAGCVRDDTTVRVGGSVVTTVTVPVD